MDGQFHPQSSRLPPSDSLLFSPEDASPSPAFPSFGSGQPVSATAEGFPFGTWRAAESYPSSPGAGGPAPLPAGARIIIGAPSFEGYKFGSAPQPPRSPSTSTSSRSHQSSDSSDGTTSSFSSTSPVFSFSQSLTSSPVSCLTTPSTSFGTLPPGSSASKPPLLHLPVNNAPAPTPPSLIRRGSLPASSSQPFGHGPLIRRGSNGAPLSASSSWTSQYGIPGSPLRMEHTELPGSLQEDVEMGGVGDMQGSSQGSPVHRSSLSGSPSPLYRFGSQMPSGSKAMGMRSSMLSPASSPYDRTLTGSYSPVRRGSLPHTSSPSSGSAHSPSHLSFSPKHPLPGAPIYQSGGSPESPTLHLSPLPQAQQLHQIRQPSFKTKSNQTGYPFPVVGGSTPPSSFGRGPALALPKKQSKTSSKSPSSTSSAAGSSTPNGPPAAPAQPLSPHLLADHVLNPLFDSRYVLTSSLGSGGYGFVCVAWDRVQQKEVAVKFILAAKVPPHAWVEFSGGGEEGDGLPARGGMVPMECEVLRRVKHWGVVRGEGFYSDEKFFYLVQELHGSSWGPSEPGTPSTPGLDALSLSPPPSSLQIRPASPFAPSYALPASPFLPPTSLPPSSPATPIRPTMNMERRGSCDLFECVEAHKRFGEPRARMIFQQIVETVYYLATLGVYHRDIKDENIVIDKEYRVKLIDFGSAVWEDPSQPARAYQEFFGTTAYASPEILAHHRYRASEAEVWSLGILLCILVTGESPFVSPAFAQIGRRTPPRNGVRMSKELTDLIDRCLEVKHDKRITIEEMRGHVWFARRE